MTINAKAPNFSFDSKQYKHGTLWKLKHTFGSFKQTVGLTSALGPMRDGKSTRTSSAKAYTKIKIN